MNEKTILSHDRIELQYAVSDYQPNRPWIALIIPFGLKLTMAKHFSEFFECHYNIVVWETRSILEDSDRGVSENEFAIENHVQDMVTVLNTCDAQQFMVVGYCSGAGLALAVANNYPEIIKNLVLVHGEYVMLHDQTCMTQFSSEIDSLLSLAARDDDHLNSIFSKLQNDRFEDATNRPEGIDIPFSQPHFLRRHAANYLSYKQVDFESLAKNVQQQTLVMTGKRDVQANVTSSQYICDLIANSEMHIAPEADHYGILREESNTMITIWNYLYEQAPHCA